MKKFGAMAERVWKPSQDSDAKGVNMVQNWGHLVCFVRDDGWKETSRTRRGSGCQKNSPERMTPTMTVGEGFGEDCVNARKLRSDVFAVSLDQLEQRCAWLIVVGSQDQAILSARS